MPRARSLTTVAVAQFLAVSAAFAGDGGKAAARVDRRDDFAVGYALQVADGPVQRVRDVSGAAMRVVPGRGVAYDDALVSVPIVPDRELRAWMAEALAGEPAARRAAIVELDGSARARFTSQLGEARLAAIRLAPLDAARRDLPEWTFALRPSTVQWSKGGGDAAQLGAKAAAVGGFRLSIPGVDATRVVKVGAIEWKRDRDAQPFTIEVADVDAKGWREWFEGSASKGRTGARDGALDLLAPDGEEAVVRLKFSALSIDSLERDRGRALRVTLSCQRLACEFPTADR